MQQKTDVEILSYSNLIIDLIRLVNENRKNRTREQKHMQNYNNILVM